MSDYERRLQRLEEQVASADDRGALLMEAIRQRTDELLSPDEVRNHKGPEIPEEELAAQVEAHLNWAHAEAQRLTAKK